MTYTTSKGDTINSDLTDQEAADLINAQGPKASVFAKDLAYAVSRGRLSHKQRPWLHKLAQEIAQPKPAPAPVAHVTSAATIVAMLTLAGSKLKRPRITLDMDGREMRLQIAGPNSRYRGDVMVTDGGPYGNNVWYGRISPLGDFLPGRGFESWVVETLDAFSKNPAQFASLYGRKTGNCCFCNRELSTAESLAVGYGPVCAGHYGLPWGDVVTETVVEIEGDAFDAAYAAQERAQEAAAFLSDPDMQDCKCGHPNCGYCA